MALQASCLGFGDYVLDETARQLKQGDVTVPVTGKAFDLLAYMAKNPMRPLTKKELLDAIWPDSFVEEANLTQNVFVLRKAMGEQGSRIIQTLPGRGYQFAAVVTETTHLPHPQTTPMALIQAFEATETRVADREETEEYIPFWQSPVAAGLSVVALVLLCVTGWLGWQRYEDRVGGPPVQVVLSDLDGTTGDVVLDRTLNNALHIDLAQSPFVTVVSANTVRRTLTEMLHKPDEPLTASLARDLCERTSSQAVLHGSIAHLGSRFLLTEEATGCVDGTALASATREAATKDELPSAVEALAAKLRHGLGESRRTVARYSVPLQPVNTASLEALEDFSQASDLAQHGKIPEAIALLKRAVEIDPQFAAAYASLGIYSGNSADRAGVRTYIQKAYDLRAYANEPIQLQIQAMYATTVTQDLYQALANFHAWADLYPRNPTPWSGLVEVNRQLGHHADAIVAALHAITLNSHYVVLYYALALEQMHVGDLQASRATCDLAIAKGMDGDLIRGVLLRLAYLTRDDALLQQQVVWGDSHPNAAYVISGEVSGAIFDGRVADARRLIERMEQSNEQQGLGSVGITLARDCSQYWAEIGQLSDARAALQEGELDPEEINQLVGLVEIGDIAKTKVVLQAQLVKHPTGTLWNKFYAPLLHAEIAYAEHRPKDVIADLEATRAFSGAALDMDYLRGLAYLDLNNPAQAEHEFRAVLSRPYIDSTDQQIPLSWLNLGRALAVQNKTAEARDAYGQFFSLWSHANGDPPLLLQAHAEAEQLQH
jgi:DNA-binding winged helix-turn-helix (wHTH) protein/tetratricopeptide (TPR) repeat protein